MTNVGSRQLRKIKRRDIKRKGSQLGEIIDGIVREDMGVEIVGIETGDHMEAGQVGMTADPATGMGIVVEMWGQIIV